MKTRFHFTKTEDSAGRDARYGWSTAISSDYNLLVGAPAGKAEDGHLSGLAYLYTRIREDWEPTQFQPQDPQDGLGYGHDVAVAGQQALVLSRPEDGGPAYMPELFIFDEDANRFVFKSFIEMEQPELNYAVAMSDYYRAITQYKDEPIGAYFFTRENPNPKPMINQEGIIGRAVALCDMNLGQSIWARGVISGRAGDQPWAWLLNTDGEFMGTAGHLVPKEIPDGYGFAVACDSKTYCVSAYSEENDDRIGAVYLFETRNDLVHGQTLRSGVPGDGFGYSVAVSGSWILVGAPLANLAYLFYLDGENWVQYGIFQNMNVWQHGTRFGHSLNGFFSFDGADPNNNKEVAFISAPLSNTCAPAGAVHFWTSMIYPAAGHRVVTETGRFAEAGNLGIHKPLNY